MTWVRMDDHYPSHPKVLEVGPLAAWLNVCAWGYTARYSTDGFIPERQVPLLADVPSPLELAGRLVEVGLWERVNGGYAVHDYLDYNPSAKEVKARRLAGAKRQAEWRASHGASNGVTDASVFAPLPPPLSPSQVPSPPPTPAAAAEMPEDLIKHMVQRPITRADRKRWRRLIADYGGKIVRYALNEALECEGRTWAYVATVAEAEYQRKDTPDAQAG